MNISLTGFAGSGKSTVAKYIESNYNFKEFALADKLKQLTYKLLKLFNIQINSIDDLYNVETKNKYRSYLQQIGTECCRSIFGNDFWCEMLNDAIVENHKNIVNSVISDIRFKNEYEYFANSDYPSVCIKITGRKFDKNESQIYSHSSELDIDNIHYDYLINNDSTFDELYKQVDAIMKDLMSKYEQYVKRSKILNDIVDNVLKNSIESNDTINTTNTTNENDLTNSINQIKLEIQHNEQINTIDNSNEMLNNTNLNKNINCIESTNETESINKLSNMLINDNNINITCEAKLIGKDSNKTSQSYKNIHGLNQSPDITLTVSSNNNSANITLLNQSNQLNQLNLSNQLNQSNSSYSLSQSLSQSNSNETFNIITTSNLQSNTIPIIPSVESDLSLLSQTAEATDAILLAESVQNTSNYSTYNNDEIVNEILCDGATLDLTCFDNVNKTKLTVSSPKTLIDISIPPSLNISNNLNISNISNISNSPVQTDLSNTPKHLTISTDNFAINSPVHILDTKSTHFISSDPIEESTATYISTNNISNNSNNSITDISIQNELPNECLYTPTIQSISTISTMYPPTQSSYNKGRIGELSIAELISSANPKLEIIDTSKKAHSCDLHVIDRKYNIKYLVECKNKQRIDYKIDIVKFIEDVELEKQVQSTSDGMTIIGLFLSINTDNIPTIGQCSFKNGLIYLTREYINKSIFITIFDLFRYSIKINELNKVNDKNIKQIDRIITKTDLSPEIKNMLNKLMNECQKLNQEEVIYNRLMKNAKSTIGDVEKLLKNLEIKKTIIKLINFPQLIKNESNETINTINTIDMTDLTELNETNETNNTNESNIDYTNTTTNTKQTDKTAKIDKNSKSTKTTQSSKSNKNKTKQTKTAKRLNKLNYSTNDTFTSDSELYINNIEPIEPIKFNKALIMTDSSNDEFASNDESEMSKIDLSKIDSQIDSTTESQVSTDAEQFIPIRTSRNPDIPIDKWNKLINLLDNYSSNAIKYKIDELGFKDIPIKVLLAEYGSIKYDIYKNHDRNRVEELRMRIYKDRILPKNKYKVISIDVITKEFNDFPELRKMSSFDLYRNYGYKWNEKKPE